MSARNHRTGAGSAARRRDVLAGSTGRAVLGVVGVLLVASCLRPAITSVGPVLHRIGTDAGLGPGLLGLLAALPLLAFAGMSPFAHVVARRIGTDVTVLGALLLLVIGLVLRAVPAPALLWVGTLVLGVGIAIGNVLVPAVVKRDFAGHISAMTGSYTATMNTFAAIASGVSVPIAGWAVGGWRSSVGVWVLPAAAAMIIWVLRMRRIHTPDLAAPEPAQLSGRGVDQPTDDHQPAADDHHRPRLWRSPLAWQVTLHMGLQSTVFYTLVNWLPSIEAEHGVSAATAGTHLFIYQAVGIGAALSMTLLMGGRDQRALAVLITVPMAITLVGLLTLPQWVVLWSVLGGMTSASAVALALALIGLRTADPHDTARLSGMAQGVGYLLAAGGPIVAGSVREQTGSWAPVLVLLMLLTVAQAVFGGLAGRDRVIGRS